MNALGLGEALVRRYVFPLQKVEDCVVIEGYWKLSGICATRWWAKPHSQHDLSLPRSRPGETLQEQAVATPKSSRGTGVLVQRCDRCLKG